jgi:Spy/CpxP family protein refolding chaperone
MFKAMSAMLALAVSLAIVGSLAAAEKPKRPEGPRGWQPGFERIEMMVKDLNLTDEQKAKVAELKKEYTPKFKEAVDTLDGILAPEQKKARDDAMKTARDAGKRGREVFQAGVDAMKLTDEQKTKRDDAFKALQAVGKEAREKVVALLTPEQKEKLKEAREKMRNRSRQID